MAADEQKVIFSMVGVSKSHGQKTVLRDISRGFFYGAKIGVLGLNGAGKSTLLRIMAGVEESSNGEVVRAPGYTVGLLDQEPELEQGKTVLAVVEEGASVAKALLEEFDALADRFSEPMDDDETQKVLDRQADVQDKIEAMGAWELDSRLEFAMDALRCPPGDTVVDVLSGGERRRVALCRLLIQQPDILLLDEPTNHLDDLSVAWLERHLKEYRAPSSPSPTTATSSTTSPAGSSSSTAAAASPGRGTTRRGSSRSRSGCGWRSAARAAGRGPSNASSSGSGWRRVRATPRARRGSTPTRSCSPRSRSRWSAISRSGSHPGRGSATW